MNLLIDTSKSAFIAASEPEAVIDQGTSVPKMTPEGQPLFSVQVVMLGGDRADVIKVRVAGKPSGVSSGVPIKVDGLMATPWSMGDRSGVSFRADRIAATQVRG